MSKLSRKWQLFKECSIGAAKHTRKPLFWCSPDNVTMTEIDGVLIPVLNRTEETVEKMRAMMFFVAMVLPNGVILTDNLFDNLSPNTKKFTLSHEKAHIERSFIDMSTIKEEAACDMIAIMNNGFTREEVIKIYDELIDTALFSTKALKKRKKIVLYLM